MKARRALVSALFAACAAACLLAAAGASSVASGVVLAAHGRFAQAALRHGFDLRHYRVNEQAVRMGRGCFDAVDPDACARRCYQPLAGFGDARCFPSEPFPELKPALDAASLGGLLDDFDLDAAAAPSAAEQNWPFTLADAPAVDRLCSCKGSYLRLARLVADAVRCVSGGGADLGPLVEFLDSAVDYACTKNGPDYCLLLFSRAAEPAGESCAQSRDALDRLGCCVRTTHDFFAGTNFEALNSIAERTAAAVGGGGGDDDDDDDALVYDYDLAYDSDESPLLRARRSGLHDWESGADFHPFASAMAACDIPVEEVAPCLAPGQSDVFTVVSATVPVDAARLGDAEVARQFRAAVARDLADAAGLAPLGVTVVGVEGAGPVLVELSVRGAEAEASVRRAVGLAGGFPLPRTAAALGSGPILLPPGSVSARVATVSAPPLGGAAAEPEPAPAASAAWALPAALLTLVAALFN